MSGQHSEDLFAATLTPLEASLESGANLIFIYSQLKQQKIPSRKTTDGRWEISRAGFAEWKVGYSYRRRPRSASVTVNGKLQALAEGSGR